MTVFSDFFLTCVQDLWRKIKEFKKYLDEAIYYTPATALCEIPPSFSLWSWGFSFEWPNCTTLQ